MPSFLSSLAAGIVVALSFAQAAVPARAAAAAVRIDGSSTVFPILEQAVRAFRATRPSPPVAIQLLESGTSAGFRQFCQGMLPLANASRPISGQELRQCRERGVTFVELPIAFDAITVVVNPRNTWASRISTQELRRLWSRAAEGRIRRWNQVNAAWPDRPIRLCGPGPDSGTFDYFNKAINGDPANARRDVTASEDDHVLVRCVSSDLNALGYFGYAYYAANRSRLRSLAVVGPAGAVEPSVAAVQKQRYVPLSRPLFLYVNDRQLRERPELRRFVTFTLQNGLQLVKQAGTIPLPPDTYRLVETKLYRHVLGSAFGGDLPVGLSISQTLQRSLEALKKPAYR
jgi:phosphate transport system substrate-binding protein